MVPVKSSVIVTPFSAVATLAVYGRLRLSVFQLLLDFDSSNMCTGVISGSPTSEYIFEIDGYITIPSTVPSILSPASVIAESVVVTLTVLTAFPFAGTFNSKTSSLTEKPFSD